ncbi:MAG: CBS domain-containing protein [Nitrospira sp.]|nr:CBS domain-containing protein [Nitrospira sp.]
MSSDEKTRPTPAIHQNPVVAHMMTPGVVQIPGDVSVTEAASLLEREQTPCLLVKDTESSFGLMTPTDIVKKVVAQGLEPDDIEVRTIMTRPVQFIEYDRAADDASTMMMTNGTPILIVTKQAQPVGVLTARDLILAPKRCLVHIPATLRVTDGNQPGSEFHATIVEISHVGALVEPSTSLLSDASVILNFSLPSLARPLTIRGQVVSDYGRGGVKPSRTAAGAVDIQFVKLSSTDQSTIKAWVLQHSPPSSDLY